MGCWGRLSGEVWCDLSRLPRRSWTLKSRRNSLAEGMASEARGENTLIKGGET